MFYVAGQTSKLSGDMIDNIDMSLNEWTVRPNRWSDLEVMQTLGSRIEKYIQ